MRRIFSLDTNIITFVHRIRRVSRPGPKGKQKLRGAEKFKWISGRGSASQMPDEAIDAVLPHKLQVSRV